MKMVGELIKEQLSNELGFESDRARSLPRDVTAGEISIFWKESGLPKLTEENYIALANAALISGLAGKQKLTELLFKFIDTNSKSDPIEVEAKISVIASKYQSVINLSRNRSTYVNAHLNLLDPDRTMRRIYSPYLSDIELKKFQQKAQNLLRQEIGNKNDLNTWITDVHALLNDICLNAVENSSDTVTQDSDDRVKGIISQKSMSTYCKQWEMFVIEVIGPSFGIQLKDIELSPLNETLKSLESSKDRSWTNIARDITEAEKSGLVKKRMNTTVVRSTTVLRSELITHEFPLKGNRPCVIQRSVGGLTKDIVAQFIQGMKAQLVIYEGKGEFKSSMNHQGATINLSIMNATKADSNDIEEWLLAFIK